MVGEIKERKKNCISVDCCFSE